MSRLIFILKALAIVICICSCGSIKGVITEVKEDTVMCQGQRFKMLVAPPKLNSYATFKPTLNRKLINCKKIKQ